VTLFAPGHALRLPGAASDADWKYVSGTSFSSPYVVALMTVFINYEGLSTRATTVNERLTQNMQRNWINYTPGTFASSGLENPARLSYHPYYGPPKDELRVYEGLAATICK